MTIRNKTLRSLPFSERDISHRYDQRLKIFKLEPQRDRRRLRDALLMTPGVAKRLALWASHWGLILSRTNLENLSTLV